MTDDHDRCEWVNVSFGTGSPGLSQTKSREAVKWLCVCMCVLASVVLSFVSLAGKMSPK